MLYCGVRHLPQNFPVFGSGGGVNAGNTDLTGTGSIIPGKRYRQ